MRWLLRLLGGVVLLLSVVVFASCVAGIGAIWMYRPPAVQKVQDISGRLADGLNRAATATSGIERSLTKARDAVTRVNRESANLGGGADSDRVVTGLIRRVVQDQVGPGVSDLGGRLATLTDTAVAVSSMLQSLEEMTAGKAGHLSPESLERGTAQAAQLSTTLRRLQAAVGDGATPATQIEVSSAAREVDEVLQRCLETVRDWQTDLNAVREEIPQLEARLLRWLWLGAIGLTVAGVWIAISQISLFVHGWQWCRSA